MNLIRDGVAGGVWADVGSGTGAFTLALAELLGGPAITAGHADARAMEPGLGGPAITARHADARAMEPGLGGPAGQSVIHSVDKDRGALAQQARAMRERFPDLTVHYLAADYARPLELPPLDGIVAANTLHFHRDKEGVVSLLRSYLKPGGRFILVEYNIDHGNFAVPHPLSFTAWQALARRSGFAETRLLATRPSRFLREIYSAVSS